MPRILANAVASSVATDQASANGTRYFVIWSGVVAFFTASSFVISVVVWGRAGYLGTLFFLCAPLAWLLRWLSGDTGDRKESEEFDNGISATLSGCVVGTVFGWAIGRFL